MKTTSILLLINLLFVSAALAQEPHPAETRARMMVSEMLNKQGIPGLSIAVAVDNKIIWSEGFGFADLENPVRVTPKTAFRVGSISKLFTAVALAKLFERGMLDLEAPIQMYVPDFPKKQYEITSRQLAGHLSGIRHYEKRTDFINFQHYTSVSDGLKAFQNDPLSFQPGSRYGYSSYGYVLLSNVVQGAAKQDFVRFLQDEIFNPLNMKNTYVDDIQTLIPNRSRFYSKSSTGKTINEMFTDNSDRIGAGGFLSSSEDLVRFGSAMLANKLIGAETRSLMFTSQRTKDGTETGVGLGWRIGKDKKGRIIYHHGGTSAGGRAFVIVYPKSKVVIAMVCNLTVAKFAEREIETIAALFIESI